mmetsp:Transcript_4985/g.9878  ORF Transcript_4985/g.9878 Transcript_4985/m.9878 type:complete len:212 (+) Transcript_4985:992-1627(+)
MIGEWTQQEIAFDDATGWIADEAVAVAVVAVVDVVVDVVAAAVVVVVTGVADVVVDVAEVVFVTVAQALVGQEKYVVVAVAVAAVVARRLLRHESSSSREPNDYCKWIVWTKFQRATTTPTTMIGDATSQRIQRWNCWKTPTRQMQEESNCPLLLQGRNSAARWLATRWRRRRRRRDGADGGDRGGEGGGGEDEGCSGVWFARAFEGLVWS